MCRVSKAHIVAYAFEDRCCSIGSTSGQDGNKIFHFTAFVLMNILILGLKKT